MSLSLFNQRVAVLPSVHHALNSITRGLTITKNKRNEKKESDKSKSKNKSRKKAFTAIKYCSIGTASLLAARRLWIIHRMNRIQRDLLRQLSQDSLLSNKGPSFPYTFARSLKLAAMFFPIALTTPLAFLNCPNSRILNGWWWLVERTVNRAGPTWIKFMQWLSTRPDMIPMHICAKLSRFQTNCKEHPFQDTLAVLQRSINVEKTFAHINPTPIASGSMGQVYEATLRSPLGHFFDSKVALKVVHPGVSRSVRADLRILSGLKSVFEHLPFFNSIPLTEAFTAFRDQMLNHLDLRKEAVNLCKFNINFSSIWDRCFRFPRPFPGLVQRGFLVESYEPGVPIRRVADGCNSRLKAAVARLCMDGFLKMMFRDNFMHMDLHPGNILVHERGRLLSPHVVFLDPGLTASLSKEKMRNFCEMCFLVSSKRSKEAAAMMIDRGPKGTKCSPEQRGK